MSQKPFSSMIHREDGGSVYSSIRNDGTIIHWCDKCNTVWISKESPEAQITQVKGIDVDKRDIAKTVSELKGKFGAKSPKASH